MNRTGNPQLTGDNLDLHLASRLYYHHLIVDTANSLGIAPYYWDNSDINPNNGNGSGIFNRNTATVFDQDTVTALTGPTLPGDFSGDGTVDAADYTVWRDGFGSTYSIDDYEKWKTNFGRTLAGGGSLSAAVPEPVSSMLLVAGLIGASSIHHRSWPVSTVGTA
jgi:hypothetical protein